MIIAISSLRLHVAEYVDDLAYVVTNMLFAVGLRIPYSRWSEAILTFLRDVSEPLLRPIRRLLPSLGGFDFSPIIAILVVRVVGSLAARAIS
jgi:YggT family protein